VSSLIRHRIEVTGIVQGVGFRPFAYRLAHDLGVTGLVRNAERGVIIEVQGAERTVEQFTARLPRELPLPGRIESHHGTEIAVVEGECAFAIDRSATGGSRTVGLAADLAVCPDCLREMNDPNDRRYRYPFITCTRCGPRYTITEDLPYDRERTTMARFAMCPDCYREYSNPLDRRYHAQPIACPVCGPQAWLVWPGQSLEPPARQPGDPGRAIDQARELLRQGKIVAVKGIGGFLLAVDARNEGAVQRLRSVKSRPRKPLAVMVRNLETAREAALFEPANEKVLCSPAAPIVLAPANPDFGLAPGLAPGLTDLGVMLPNSPLHHLLFSRELDALVMTSGNAPNEPIITDNEAALATLGADAYLVHNRDICVGADDSVVRSYPGGLVMVRRTRGYAPGTLDARFLPARSVVALGAELKVTISTLSGGALLVGRHIGDLDNPHIERAFAHELERMLRFGGVTPEIVALDLHPDLATAVIGEKMQKNGARIHRVQHHHAHLCAVLVEYKYPLGTVAAGVILDGFGYGTDGAVWGGELLLGGYESVQRAGHLRNIAQPGGDRAAREPGRMATSLLLDAGFGPDASPAFDPRIAEICAIRAVSPLTSSTGRLFDGVAAILGIAPLTQSYEAEAASLLETAADPAIDDAYPLPINGDELDTRALVSALVRDRAPLATRAARFHNGVADGFARMALGTGASLAVLSGGSIVNRQLLSRLERTLTAGGMEVIRPKVLPAGDGALSAGQAAAAAVATK
jgi:hydrogenase maturation protein HypF